MKGPFGSRRPVVSTLQRLIQLVVMLLFALAAPLCAAEISGDAALGRQILFSMSPEGYPPFLVRGQQGAAGGIMLDVLREISSRLGYKVALKFYPENRETYMLVSGKIDCRAKAREWVKDPDRFTWSDPIIDATDVLVFLRTRPMRFRMVDDLIGKKIIAHLGYTYPVLDPLFADKRIHRFDMYNETVMLDELLKAQHEAAVMNKQVALWLIKNNVRFQGRFQFSERIIDRVGYRIMFTSQRDWGPFAQRFNQELSRMRRDETLARIFSRYLPED